MSFLKQGLKKIKGHIPHPGHDSSESDVGNLGTSTPSKLEGVDASARSLTGLLKNNGKGSGKSSPKRSSSARQSRDFVAAEKTRKSVDKHESKLEHRKHDNLAQLEDERFLREGPENLTKLYKPFSMNQSKTMTGAERQNFRDLDFAGKSFYLLRQTYF